MMRKTGYALLLFCLFACRFQRDKIASLDSLPVFKLLLIDSTTILNSSRIPAGKPILLLYFSPGCTHCQAETIALLKHMDELQDTRLYFLTEDSFDELKAFYRFYKLEKYKNITVGKDIGWSFWVAFKPSAVPYMAIYDGQRKLVKIYLGEEKISTIRSALSI